MNADAIDATPRKKTKRTPFERFMLTRQCGLCPLCWEVMYKGDRVIYTNWHSYDRSYGLCHELCFDRRHTPQSPVFGTADTLVKLVPLEGAAT